MTLKINALTFEITTPPQVLPVQNGHAAIVQNAAAVQEEQAKNAKSISASKPLSLMDACKNGNLETVKACFIQKKPDFTFISTYNAFITAIANKHWDVCFEFCKYERVGTANIALKKGCNEVLQHIFNQFASKNDCAYFVLYLDPALFKIAAQAGHLSVLQTVMHYVREFSEVDQHRMAIDNAVSEGLFLIRDERTYREMKQYAETHGILVDDPTLQLEIALRAGAKERAEAICDSIEKATLWNAANLRIFDLAVGLKSGTILQKLHSVIDLSYNQYLPFFYQACASRDLEFLAFLLENTTKYPAYVALKAAVQATLLENSEEILQFLFSYLNDNFLSDKTSKNLQDALLELSHNLAQEPSLYPFFERIFPHIVCTNLMLRQGACGAGNIKALTLIFNKVEKVNHFDMALNIAALSGQFDVIKFLLNHGGKFVDHCNRMDNSVLKKAAQVATEHGFSEISDYLYDFCKAYPYQNEHKE